MSFAYFVAVAEFPRPKVPIFHCETNRVSHLAVEWLDQQAAAYAAMAYAAANSPVDFGRNEKVGAE